MEEEQVPLKHTWNSVLDMAWMLSGPTAALCESGKRRFLSRSAFCCSETCFSPAYTRKTPLSELFPACGLGRHSCRHPN